MTLEEILEQSPEIAIYGGGKWAMYSVRCCWWTSFPEDLGTLAVSQLPCCPHCGSVLLQAPLEEFVAMARENPDYYGKYGVEVFVLAHSRNYDHCYRSWSDYNLILWAREKYGSLSGV